MLRDLQARRHDQLEAVFRDRLGLVGKQVVIDAGVQHTGKLVNIDFQRLQLDGGTTFPLAIVRGIRPVS
jgi:hypothetical protein